MQPAAKGIYVLIDPFNRTDSGVTTYTLLASSLIEAAGTHTKIIKISAQESIEQFCQRLKSEIRTLPNIICVEAPESLASTRMLDSSLPIHIRLHCSRSLGAAVQGLPFEKNDVDLEQREITRASFISAPSWAAYFASNVLFKFKKTPIFFPNPAPSFDGISSEKKEYDVLFVGRFQKLKGIKHLEYFAKNLPNLKFGVVCPPIEKSIELPENIQLVDGNTLSKSEIYSLSNLVIVPSVFETSSMVAIEALAYGNRVITWEHLGVAEYFPNSPDLLCIPSDNADKFTKAIASNYTAVKKNSRIKYNQELNGSFVDGISSMLAKSVARPPLTRPKKKIEKYLKNLVKSQIKIMKKKKQSPFIKKAKKLFLHPVDFFRDSTEAKYIRRKLSERRLNQLRVLRNEFRDHPEFAAKTPAEPNTINSSTVKAILEHSTPEIKNTILNNYFTSIEDEGRIEIKTSPSKPSGYATAFLHDNDADSDSIIKILDKLNTFEDFKYVNTERMQLGRFSISKNVSALSITNRIDIKSKASLSEINFIILLNAPQNLCNALRYAGTEQKIILIKTEESLEIDTDSIDVVISVFKEQKQSQIRRLIEVNSALDIPTAIRRALQEGFPRKKDMLLQIILKENENFERLDFLNFDSRYYQGILKIRATDHSTAKTMNDIYGAMEDSVTAIAVLESIYMKYRSQCESVEQGGSPAELIKACLKDGVLFDVKEV